MQYTPQGDISLTGRYTLSGGIMKYSLPIIPLKEFQINNGSYVDWRGDPMNPTLNLKATERMRASVADGDDGGSRVVNFDVSIAIKNRLDAPELIFDITAPDDATIENELQAMGAEERSKQAIAMLATRCLYEQRCQRRRIVYGQCFEQCYPKSDQLIGRLGFPKHQRKFHYGYGRPYVSRNG